MQISDFQQDVPLHNCTTIRLGGKAKYFVSCTNVAQLVEILQTAHAANLRVHILGGGSNTLFSDDGFDGLVIKINLKGISFIENGATILATVQAGEVWDEFVAACIERGFAGVECLSGIPGSVGATPIQNVGAYGQEVKDTIVSVAAIERDTLTEKKFTNAECSFAYRESRFKLDDKDRYIVTAVTFRLQKNGAPTIHYPELKKYIESHTSLYSLANGAPKLHAVRDSVLSLRRKKSMVVDSTDPHSCSVGSFFLNPIVNNGTYTSLNTRWKESGHEHTIPTFAAQHGVKIPAAWLIEQAGFSKGYREGGVGISGNHTLALVNYSGTTHELLALAKKIQDGVFQKFSIQLSLEPVIVE